MLTFLGRIVQSSGKPRDAARRLVADRRLSKLRMQSGTLMNFSSASECFDAWEDELHAEYPSHFQRHRLASNEMVARLQYAFDHWDEGSELLHRSKRHGHKYDEWAEHLREWKAYASFYDAVLSHIQAGQMAEAFCVAARYVPFRFWFNFWEWVSACEPMDELTEFLCERVFPLLLPQQEPICRAALQTTIDKITDLAALDNPNAQRALLATHMEILPRRASLGEDTRETMARRLTPSRPGPGRVFLPVD